MNLVPYQRFRTQALLREEWVKQQLAEAEANAKATVGLLSVDLSSLPLEALTTLRDMANAAFDSKNESGDTRNAPQNAA
jgi:hypothetical protein